MTDEDLDVNDHVDDKVATCEKCGTTYTVGDSPFCKDKHASLRGHGFVPHPFSPYWDDGLGMHVESRDQHAREMKSRGFDFKDRLSDGEISARKDQRHERRKQQDRMRS